MGLALSQLPSLAELQFRAVDVAPQYQSATTWRRARMGLRSRVAVHVLCRSRNVYGLRAQFRLRARAQGQWRWGYDVGQGLIEGIDLSRKSPHCRGKSVFARFRGHRGRSARHRFVSTTNDCCVLFNIPPGWPRVVANRSRRARYF
jgi:hypothetical protein